ncbi:MAG TPA: GTP-binding protein [Leptolyngbyaceae cyanobacterium]
MRRWQLVPLILATLLVLIFLIWLVESVSRFYSSLTLTSPFLANLFLGLVITLVLIVLGTVGYYGWLFLRPRQQRARPQVSQDPAIAAEANLDALQRQIAQIQDEIAREALQERSQSLASEADRRDVNVTVFGVGSAGKTSLINTLVGEPVGEVAAPMGTTQERQIYRWQPAGFSRGILLTDTPGISEASVAGTLREQDARQLATEADLVLFVIDDDLRQSEYQLVRSLLEINKRLLVVLNKADRYPDAELEAILTRVRSHFHTILAPADVVAVAANPAPLPLEGGGWFQMDADVSPLIERMAQVLRAEGDALIADNLLLQSQRLREEARRLIDSQRQQEADTVVERYQWIGAGVIAVTPLPGLDLLAAAAINAQMVVELGRVYGCNLSIEEGKELALSLARTLTGLGIVRGAVELLAIGLQTNLATALAGRALQGISAAYLTRIAGKSFIEYFRHNQDWGDGGMGEVVQEQFRLNQREAFIKTFVQDAIAQALPSQFSAVFSPTNRQPKPSSE